ncbi:beta strand repeat-containing protein, partial [Mycolicibacterium hippocampi]
DLDSDDLGSATVTLNDAGAGDSFGWGTLPTDVSASVSGGVLTFTGAATAAEYQQLLQSVTLTSADAGIKTVTFAVVDGDGNESLVPAISAVTVVGVPGASLAPVVVATPVAAGATGSAITISPVVVITDLDSDDLGSATVTLNDAGAGDSFGWGSLPTDVTASVAGGVLTFTGTATVAEYQQLLQSVTLTSTDAGIKTVTFAVVDADGNPSLVPAISTVTVVGLPGATSPTVLTSVINVSYTAGSSGVPVDSGLIVLDADSTTMTGATVTITDPAAGDVLTYGSLPDGVTADFDSGVLIFEGSASVSEYQQLLRSVTFSTDASALATIKTISFTITDDQNGVSAPGVVAVTVLSLPILATPVVVTSVANVGYTAGDSAIPVDPGLVLLDADSTNMSGAVVSIVGGAAVGETLDFTPQAGINGSYNSGVLTFDGDASVAAYQQVLRSVTFSTNSDALATIKSISFVVTDDQDNVSGTGFVAVTVVTSPLQIPPLVTTSVVNVSYTAGDGAITVDPAVGVLDLDSTDLDGATVKITGGFAPGDTLTFTEPEGITGDYDEVTGTLTFTGTESIAKYEEALRSVQLSTSASALATIKTVSFAVVDAEGMSSLPGTVAVTVLAAPVNLAPLVVTTVVGPIYTAGNTAVTVDSLVSLADLDSTDMAGATVTINGGLTTGDVLTFTPPEGSLITGDYDSVTGTLTLSGTGTLEQYQEALRSVTYASSGVLLASVKAIAFAVTDSEGATSVPGLVSLTVVANTPPLLTTALLGTYVNGTAPQLLSPGLATLIVDESSFLQNAVVTIANPENDTLSFTPTGAITGNYSGGVLTLTGLGTVAEYETVLRSVRFSSSGLFQTGVRSITFVTQDQQGLNSNETLLLLTVIL